MAVTITADQLGPRILGNHADHSELVAGVLAAATALVLQYAPDAPDEIHDEAVIRLAGYLAGSDFGGISEETIGSMTVKRPVNHAAILRNSGAAALLTRWRVRRASSLAGSSSSSGAGRLLWNGDRILWGGDELRWRADL